MWSRYPKQERDRKGMALIGLVLLVFGVVMALFGAWFMSAAGFLLGFACALPAIALDEAAFSRFQRLLSHFTGLS